jgi:hypothetical protein
MTKDFDYRILVRVSENASLPITTVFSAPRQCTPGEVLSAYETIAVMPEDEEMPQSWLNFATFIAKDFFLLAHRTGLYNRQNTLWRTIGRIVEVKAIRPPRGLFARTDKPFAHFSFFDGRGNRVIWAVLVDQPPKGSKLDTDKGRKKFIFQAIKTAEKIQKKEGSLNGLFIGLSGPVSESVLDVVARITGASNPVKRYEALLPQPLNVPLNMVSFEQSDGEANSMQFRLCYPRLRPKGVAVDLTGAP